MSPSGYHHSPAKDLFWRVFQPRAEGALPVLCLPYSGGASSAFRPLQKALGEAYSVIGVDLPGHALGDVSPPLDSVGAIVDRLHAELPPECYAGGLILGASLGGLLALHLAARCLQSQGPKPSGLVLLGSLPFSRRADVPKLADLPASELRRWLIAMGALAQHVDDRLLAGREVQLRADLRANDEAEAPETQVRLPSLILGGTEDVYCRPAFLEDWRAFVGEATLDLVPGPHIFVDQAAEAVAARIHKWWSKPRERR